MSSAALLLLARPIVPSNTDPPFYSYLIIPEVTPPSIELAMANELINTLLFQEKPDHLLADPFGPEAYTALKTHLTYQMNDIASARIMRN